MRKCKNDFVKHLDFRFELIPWVIVTELTTEFETVLSVVPTVHLYVVILNMQH